MMEVSADGIIMCTNGYAQCSNYHKHGDRKIIVEIKSPYPSEENPELVYYEVLPRHVPQILSEIKAYDATEAWLLCAIQRSATLISISFDHDLWNNMFGLVEEFYGDENPKMQTKVHPNNLNLHLHINQFIQTNCVLLAEVPTITAVYGNVYLDPNFSSPFSPNCGRNSTNPEKELVTNMNKFISIDAKSAFTSCHEVLHTPAKELLVFMLTNKDRKQNKHVPYSYPVAYALKGSSMSNCDLHFMVNKLRNELKKRNINVLCEAYDGQWHNHIVLGSNGQHLTKMHGKITC